MNGVDFIIDTNFIIAINTGLAEVSHVLNYRLGIASICEIEVLGYSDIKSIDIVNYKKIISSCEMFHLTDEIRSIAIELRKKQKIKTPDSIIAATAIYSGVPLITKDKGFQRISGLIALEY